jgi:hypothetical protein
MHVLLTEFSIAKKVMEALFYFLLKNDKIRPSISPVTTKHDIFATKIYLQLT